MYAMQYEITLPADYDMRIIRQRVASRGSTLDDFDGLALKAYLIRECGRDGSAVNQYAPFYLWADISAMGRFIWGGGGFGGVVTSFGRPSVTHWTGLGCMRGPSKLSGNTAAVIHKSPIGENLDPEPVARSAIESLRKRSQVARVQLTAAAIDPARWEVLHFTLWDQIPEEEVGARYKVMHLSMPSLDEIVGRPCD